MFYTTARAVRSTYAATVATKKRINQITKQASTSLRHL